MYMYTRMHTHSEEARWQRLPHEWRMQESVRVDDSGSLDSIVYQVCILARMFVLHVCTCIIYSTELKCIESSKGHVALASQFFHLRKLFVCFIFCCLPDSTSQILCAYIRMSSVHARLNPRQTESLCEYAKIHIHRDLHTHIQNSAAGPVCYIGQPVVIQEGTSVVRIALGSDSLRGEIRVCECECFDILWQ